MAIGRLPVRTAAEADQLVAKVVAQDQNWDRGGALLVASHDVGFLRSVLNAGRWIAHARIVMWEERRGFKPCEEKAQPDRSDTNGRGEVHPA